MSEVVVPSFSGGAFLGSGARARIATASETSHHVFLGAETFDVTCLRLDDDFKDWVNATWSPSPEWDGTLDGSIGGSNPDRWGWISLNDGVSIQAHFQLLFPKFIIEIFDFTNAGSSPRFGPWTGDVFQPYHSGAVGDASSLGLFGNYSCLSPMLDGPVLRFSGPTSFNLEPCDLINPPDKLSFWSAVRFDTPTGTIADIPILQLFDKHPPYKWGRQRTDNLFDMEFTVIQAGTDAYCLMGCVPEGQPMQYAEFDLLDVPASPPSPVGIFKRGNAHGFDGLPDGISWSALAEGSLDYLSVFGQ